MQHWDAVLPGKVLSVQYEEVVVFWARLRTKAPEMSIKMHMTESEISALLDAHDALVKAYVHSTIMFAEFVSAYGDFPHSYALDGGRESTEERAVLRLFRKRIAFHLRVSGVLSGLRSADGRADISHGDAGRFLPAVGLIRLRELLARHPDFKAETDAG